MLSATPAPQRTSVSQSRPPPSSRSRATPRSTARDTAGAEDTQSPELPAYEPPESILSIDASRSLHLLLEKQYLETAKKHIYDAGVHITNCAGEVSDRLRDAQTRYQKAKEKRRAEGGGQDEGAEGDDDEYQRLAEQEREVNSIMGRLEEKMRDVVDSEVKLVELKDSLGKIDREEAQSQHLVLGARQLRSQRRPTRHHADEDEEDEPEEDPDREPTPVRELRERNAQNPPSQRLNTALDEGQKKWEELSLTQRYANNNTYTGFYRMVHEAKYPDNEAPPMPHSSTWFSHMEGPGADASNGTPGSRRTRNQRQPSPADSDDIAIERERISLQCPLTLVRFRDPVTSTKCPHSFEREAIMDMISRSQPVRGGPRVKAVKCPVCSILLTAGDLVRDTAMQRRVRRAEEQEARRAEESGSDDDDEQQNGNRVTLASDAVDSDEDAMDVDAPVGTQIKSEPGMKSERQTMGSQTGDEPIESDESDEEEEDEEEGEENEGYGDGEEESE